MAKKFYVLAGLCFFVFGTAVLYADIKPKAETAKKTAQEGQKPDPAKKAEEPKVVQSQEVQKSTATQTMVSAKEPMIVELDAKVKELIDENPLAVLSGEMSRHYFNAMVLFKDKKYEDSALEFRKGTAFLKLEYQRATNKGDATLLKTIDELEKFSIELKKGTGIDVNMFQDFTSKAFYAIANHQYFEAYEYWANKKADLAGKELKDLSYNLNQSLTGLDRKTADVKKTLTEVKTYAEEMIKGLKVQNEDIDKVIEKTRGLLENTGKLFEKK